MLFRIFSAFFTLLLFSVSGSVYAWKMEADKITVDKTNGNASTHINFKLNYSSIPLVFTLTKTTGVNPASLRVVNVTTTGFDIYSVEPEGDDGPHGKMTTIPYIAIEAGSHQFPDGTRIVAGSTNTSSFQSSSLAATSWQAVGLTGFSTTPVVLGQIQTRTNERTDLAVPSAVSQPWMTTVVNNVSSAGFDIALERSETTTGTLTGSEKIAYLAIDSGLNGGNYYFGSANGSKIEYESIRTGNIVTGWDDSTAGVTINFSKTYTDPIVIATKGSRADADGGWFRRKGISDSSISLKVDEDKAIDSERSHVAEVANILLFSKPFSADFSYPSQPAEMIINEVLYKETLTGVNNDEFVELYVTVAGDIKDTIISDQDAHFYRFPSQNVAIGDYVIYHTGAGINSSTGSVHHFYQGISNIWNNGGEDIVLLKPEQDVTLTADGKAFNASVAEYMAYGANAAGGAVDPVPISMQGTTVSWTYTYGTELDGAVGGQSISLTPNATGSNKAACWEKTTSNNASNNACVGYKATHATDTGGLLNSWGDNNNSVVEIALAKSVLTVYDPYNGASNPLAIPGSILEYTINAKNKGGLGTDSNSVEITDPTPVNTKLCVSNLGSCSAPYFIDGSPSSGLTLANVLYSNNNGTSFTYTPLADANGADANVTNLRASMNGAFQPKSGVNSPNFDLRFRVIVK